MDVEKVILNKLYNGGTENKRAYIFTNCKPELIQDIKSTKFNSINYILLNVDLSEPEFDIINGLPIDEYKRNLLIESMIVCKLERQIISLYPYDDYSEELKQIDKSYVEILNCLNNNFKLLGAIPLKYCLNFMCSELKAAKRVGVLINMYLPKDLSEGIQKTLNLFLNDHYEYKTRFFTENESICTYYDRKSVLLENGINYKGYNMKNVNSIRKVVTK